MITLHTSCSIMDLDGRVDAKKAYQVRGEWHSNTSRYL